MPIYEYQCQACGHHTELLEKFSDPPTSQCPECGKDKLIKLISATGFQLTGTGWYATDFKDKKPQPAATDSTVSAAAVPAASTPTVSEKTPQPKATETKS